MNGDTSEHQAGLRQCVCLEALRQYLLTPLGTCFTYALMNTQLKFVASSGDSSVCLSVCVCTPQLPPELQAAGCSA